MTNTKKTTAGDSDIDRSAAGGGSEQEESRTDRRLFNGGRSQDSEDEELTTDSELQDSDDGGQMFTGDMLRGNEAEERFGKINDEVLPEAGKNADSNNGGGGSWRAVEERRVTYELHEVTDTA